MSEIEQLEQAIAALEAQRTILGEAVVAAALAPMREKLAALRTRQPAEQRRLVTVLFADLVGYSTLAEKMDPEDVREMIETCFTSWSQILASHGGAVEKYIGDAVMSVFGLERAREDDAERAVQAGLELAAALHRLNPLFEQRWGVTLHVRAGVHTGPAIVNRGERSPGQLFAVVGDTVNLASRLQTIAPVDGLLISQDTYRHLRAAGHHEFHIQPMPPVTVKGRSQPVQPYLVLGTAARLEGGILEGAAGRMVGRRLELETLTRHYQQTAAHPSLALIIGEAGIGKSRLLAEFAGWLAAQPGLTLLQGRAMHDASGGAQRLPYALLRDLFARYAGILDSDPAETAVEKLNQRLGQALGRASPAWNDATRLASASAALAQLFGFTAAGQAAEDARQTNERATALLVELAAALAAEGPLALVLEDLHWADGPSLDMLARLPLSLPGLPIYILGAARPLLFERFPGWPGPAETHPATLRLDLLPLPAADSAALLQQFLERLENIPPELAERLLGASEGNPFFLEELVQMLIDDEIIDASGEAWTVHPERLAGLRLPSSLTGVLQARLDSTSPVERQVIDCAAIVGRTFWDLAVDYLVEQSQQDSAAPAAVAPALEGLSEAQLVFQHQPPAFERAREFLFKHALLRDVAYEGVLKRQRRLYHGLAARWLEAETARSGRQGEFAALIAGHYEQAGETDPAAAWHARAADLAAGQYANEEAVRHYTRALELTPAEVSETRHALLLGRLRVYDNLGDRPAQHADLLALEQSAASSQRPELTCQALLLHAEYAERIADLHAMVEYSGQAHALAAQAGLPVRQAQALLRRGQAYWRLGQYADGAAQIQQALEALGDQGNPALRGECLRNLGTIAYVQGSFQEARAYHQRALAIQEQIGDLTACSHTNTSLGNVALRLGEMDNAEQHFNLAIELSRKVNNPRREAGALTNLGIVIENRGDYAAARQIYERAAAIFQRLQDWSGYSAAISNIGSTAMSLGDYAAAEQRFDDALAIQRRQNEVEGEAISLVNLGLLAVNTGDYPTALARCREVAAAAGERGMRYLEAYAYTYLGHACLHLGQLDEAEAHYTRSLELRREMRQPGLMMDNLAGLARTNLQRKDLPAALAHAEEILALLEVHGLDSVDEPVRVYTTCYRVLQAANDRRAAGVLDDAHALLVSRAWRISDEAQRSSYLHNVPANRDLLALWENQAPGREGHHAG